MLEHIYIKNYAIIDQLELNCQSGLTAITGETGAGKSILIGAIQFVLGTRADSKVVRDSKEKCIVELRFSPRPELQNRLISQFDLDDASQIILRREIGTNGKSRSFINDTPALVSDIQSIADQLVNVHQQFDHLDILDVQKQINYLDAFINQSENIIQYKNLYSAYLQLESEKKKFEESLHENMKEKDFLEFQQKELDELNLQSGELKQIESEQIVLSKSEEILQASAHAAQLIQREQGISDQLIEVSNLLKNLQINSELKDTYDKIQDVRISLIDIANTLEHISDAVDADPKRLQKLEDRIGQIHRLLLKHRVTEDNELILLHESINERLSRIQHSDAYLIELNQKIENTKKQLIDIAQKISKARIKTAPELCKKIVDKLKLLGMEYAQCAFQIEATKEINPFGMDKIEFVFSANKGNELRSIKNQASGGELSRLNLVLKALLASHHTIPTIIFDEIDTGVSGQIGLQMGNILKDIAQHIQVFTITHSPQVASRAKQHLWVYKDTNQDKSTTKISFLNQEDRIVEIAKMLSSDPPSKSALTNAKELILLK